MIQLSISRVFLIDYRLDEPGGDETPHTPKGEGQKGAEEQDEDTITIPSFSLRKKQAASNEHFFVHSEGSSDDDLDFEKFLADEGTDEEDRTNETTGGDNTEEEFDSKMAEMFERLQAVKLKSG